MRDVTIYTTPWCGFCRRAKRILEERGIAFREVDVDGQAEKRRWLLETTGQHTVPQIFFGSESIGGCSDLEALIRAGQFEARLRDPP